ncbi:MAG: hypothetical protein Q7S40_24535 [Opitutaceae bacterium]|nr:hypothetical protein [Opitutaceae bacterium]
MHTSSSFLYPEATQEGSASAMERFNATMAAERRQLAEDQEAVRAREENLREYEARLRTMQAEIEAARMAKTGGTRPARSITPSIFHQAAAEAQRHDDPALHSGWEKLHRARELLDAEQAHLRDDAMRIHDQDVALTRREEALARREQLLAERKAAADIADSAPDPSPVVIAEKPSRSAVDALSRAPFHFARMVLGKKEAAS